MWKSQLGERLGLSVPIVQAPIGSASCPELVAAVSNAGALGMLSGTWRSPDELVGLVQETQKLTDRPFGVNLVLQWDMTERVECCLEAGVRIFSFFWGDPEPHLERIHQSGGFVFQTVGSAAEARARADQGVDAIVAQGWEAGGHVWGKVTTMALLPRVVDAVPELPVVAAGGIADGRGIVAARALGADAVWIGTRFLVAEEARVHPTYRQRLIAATEADTVYTTLFDGGWPDAPHRVLQNDTTRACESTATRPGENEIVAHYADGEPIYRYSSNLPGPTVVGETEQMALYAGQGVGLVARRSPAAEIVAALVEETHGTIQRVITHEF